MKMNGVKNNTRKIQAEERRLQILNTALSVFAERGFAGTTIKDIAFAAGMSNGLMYHYFTSKEELMKAAVKHHSFLPQLREILKDTGAQPYRQVLKDISLKFLILIENKNEIVKIFLQEGSTNPNVQRVWSSLAADGISLLTEYLTKHIANGDFKAHHAEVTARCLFPILLTFHLTKNIFKTGEISREQFVEEAIDIILDGIRNVRE